MVDENKLEKEAERIAVASRRQNVGAVLLKTMIEDFGRAVHDAGRARGFAEGIEKAARVADVYCDERYAENNTAWTLRNQIRALKIGDRK